MSSLGPIKRWVPAFLWMGVIFGLSSLPELPESTSFVPDYAMHYAAYYVLGVLCWWASATTFQGGWIAHTAVILTIVVLYGVTDELHQSLVPPREMSLTDLAADGAGGLTALLMLTHPRLSFFRSCLIRRKPPGVTMGVDTNRHPDQDEEAAS